MRSSLALTIPKSGLHFNVIHPSRNHRSGHMCRDLPDHRAVWFVKTRVSNSWTVALPSHQEQCEPLTVLCARKGNPGNCTRSYLHACRTKALHSGVWAQNEDQEQSPTRGEGKFSERIVLASFTCTIHHRELADDLQLPAILRAALPELFPSPTSARKACRKKRVLVNNALAGCIREIQVGDKVELLSPEERQKVGPTLDVLYEDDYMAVVLKPPGVKMHGRGQTMERAIGQSLQRSRFADASFTPMHCHRLDAATGGVVVAAKTREALQFLCAAFEQRRVQKRYMALVVGRLEGESHICTELDGRDSTTTYFASEHVRSLKHGWITKVDLWPRTGRKHQLRRHLQSIGHPILGDPLYGQSGSKSLRLWAMEISVPHPNDQKTVKVTTEEPAKFSEWCVKESRRWEKFHGNSDTL
mmetsp:Transcript_17409/g.33539  ORF Transcript_17409/g.33539 Transcript_17409/m.33539 type:complete len:415 (-) Transcript_17409:181-1425(-)